MSERARQHHPAGRQAAALALLAVFMLGLIGPAEAVRRRDQENPITNAPESEDDKAVELDIAPPAYPKDSKLTEFTLRGQTANRFFIDPTTLSLEKDRIIRFAMVIKSPTGETNVRYAGLRCSKREWKDYAFGRADGTWAKDEDAEWQPIQELIWNNYQRTLYKDYFCVGGVLGTKPAGDASKLVKLLKNPPKPDPRVPRKE